MEILLSELVLSKLWARATAIHKHRRRSKRQTKTKNKTNGISKWRMRHVHVITYRYLQRWNDTACCSFLRRAPSCPWPHHRRWTRPLWSLRIQKFNNCSRGAKLEDNDATSPLRAWRRLLAMRIISSTQGISAASYVHVSCMYVFVVFCFVFFKTTSENKRLQQTTKANKSKRQKHQQTTNHQKLCVA